VPPRCFAPPPKVMSEVILLEPHPVQELLPPGTAQQVESLLRRCFAARRKMLRNSLAGLLPAEGLAAVAAEAGLNLQQRPQELAPERWVALATSLNRAGGAASAAGAAPFSFPAPPRG
jgi:16S rRNA (adenine1518-N6/adenine1519-N6)-dimethyltransferase